MKLRLLSSLLLHLCLWLMPAPSLLASETTDKTALSTAVITAFTPYSAEQKLLLDGTIQYRLAPKLKAALAHEVMLTFKTDIELRDAMTYLGVPYHYTIKTIQLASTLQFLTFNQTYYLHNKRTNQIQTFHRLDDALLTLGTLSSFYLVDIAELYSHKNPKARLQSYLDRWQLPAPLILDALIDSQWQLDTDWHQLDINTRHAHD